MTASRTGTSTRRTGMSSVIKVARLHLVDRFTYTWLVWGILAFTFSVNYAIFTVIGPTEADGSYTFALISIFIFLTIFGGQAATKFLPFAFTLGVSRRTYFLGTVALVIGLCAVYSMALTGLWALELATDGWGIQMHFFQVAWVLWGPWYQVLVTNFLLMSLVFLVGLLYGLIYRRFALIGTIVFIAGIALVVAGAVLLITWRQGWPRVGEFLAGLNLLGASGILVAVALVVALGGYGTIRRITV